MNFFDYPRGGYYPHQARGYPAFGYGRDYDDEYDYDPYYQQRIRKAQEAELRQQALQRQKEEQMRSRYALQQQQQEQRRRQEALLAQKQRLAKQKAEELRKQKEMERLAALEAERQRWLEYTQDPEVRDKSAAIIQSAWRGKVERRHNIVLRLKLLRKEEEKMSQLLKEENEFYQDFSSRAQGDMPDTELRQDFKRLLAYEEKLTRQLLSLDGFSSGSSDFVRAARKELVQRIDSTLANVDTLKKALQPKYIVIETKLREAAEERARLQEQKEAEEAQKAREEAEKAREEAEKAREEAQKAAEEAQKLAESTMTDLDVQEDTPAEATRMEIESEPTVELPEEPEETKEDIPEIHTDAHSEESDGSNMEPATDETKSQDEPALEIEEESFEKMDTNYENESKEELIKRIEMMKNMLQEKDNTIQRLRELLGESGRNI